MNDVTPLDAQNAEILIERKEDYAREMTREMGKVLAETRGDVQEAIDAAYYNAGEGRRLFGPTVPSEMPNKFAMAVRQPIGVCGMITPWNFPMAISSWKLLPAIVCGNTCVIKPAQDTPLSTFNLVRALADAGLPKGVINIVAGFGAEVGTPIAEHADVRLTRFERRVAVPVAHAALQLEGDAADDPAFLHRHEDRGPRGPLADVREPGEVSLPTAVAVRRDELAVGLGRDPAGLGMVLGESLAGHDRHGRGRVQWTDGQPD